jgi:hypothetical protein
METEGKEKVGSRSVGKGRDREREGEVGEKLYFDMRAFRAGNTRKIVCA